MDVVDSTNDVTKDFAMQNEEEGLVVIAEEQKKGKGRKGRAWASPRGGNMDVCFTKTSTTSRTWA